MTSFRERALVTARSLLVGAILLLGGSLLTLSRTLWRQMPDLLSAYRLRPIDWRAFNVGLTLVAISLLALALAAGWRLVSTRAVRPPVDGALARLAPFGAGPKSPARRYATDVALCLVTVMGLVAAPVVLVGGPVTVFLKLSWPSFAMISLLAAGTLGVLRR